MKGSGVLPLTISSFLVKWNCNLVQLVSHATTKTIEIYMHDGVLQEIDRVLQESRRKKNKCFICDSSEHFIFIFRSSSCNCKYIISCAISCDIVDFQKKSLKIHRCRSYMVSLQYASFYEPSSFLDGQLYGYIGHIYATFLRYELLNAISDGCLL